MHKLYFGVVNQACMSNFDVLNVVIIPTVIAIFTGFLIGVVLYLYFSGREKKIEYNHFVGDLLVTFNVLLKNLEKYKYEIDLRKYHAFNIKKLENVLSREEMILKSLLIEKSEVGKDEVEKYQILFISLRRRLNIYALKNNKVVEIKGMLH